jgi:hypothetical protein
LFLARTIVLDLVCLQIFEAKIRSSDSIKEGCFLVDMEKSLIASVFLSLS